MALFIMARFSQRPKLFRLIHEILEIKYCVDVKLQTGNDRVLFLIKA